MHLRKRTSLLAGVIFLAGMAPALAQNSIERSAYFMEGYLYRHRINPAQYSYKGYTNIATGNISVGTNSSFGIKTFFFPGENGVLNTALSPQVTEQQFLSKLRRNNLLSANVDVEILGFGFIPADRWYGNFSLGLRGYLGTAVPYDLFRFLKSGSSDGNLYDLSGLGIRARAYFEVGFGLSAPIGERLRVGAKIKGLMGVLSADATMEKLDLSLSGSQWTIAGRGMLRGTLGPLSFGTKEAASDPTITDVLDFGAMSFNGLAGIIPSSFGWGLDVGATYDVLPWLQVSAAVLDIGSILWKNTLDARMERTYQFSGVTVDATGSGETPSLDQQLDAELGKLKEMLEFRVQPEAKPAASALATTVNVGVQAFLPAWRKLSAGLLVTHRFEEQYSWTEGRITANVAPLSWLGLGLGYAVSSFGSTFDACIHLQLPLVSLFVAAEIPSFVFTPPYDFQQWRFKMPLPLGNLNINAKVGLNMVFGKRFDRRFPQLTPAQRRQRDGVSRGEEYDEYL